VQVEGLGRKFAVFRGTKEAGGGLGVLGAFCPHNGANLAGGDVVGVHLRCPFHLIEFEVRNAPENVVVWSLFLFLARAPGARRHMPHAISAGCNNQ
jgi:hypothetical protein